MDLLIFHFGKLAKPYEGFCFGRCSAKHPGDSFWSVAKSPEILFLEGILQNPRGLIKEGFKEHLGTFVLGWFWYSLGILFGSFVFRVWQPSRKELNLGWLFEVPKSPMDFFFRTSWKPMGFQVREEFIWAVSCETPEVWFLDTYLEISVTRHTTVAWSWPNIHHLNALKKTSIQESYAN